MGVQGASCTHPLTCNFTSFHPKTWERSMGASKGWKDLVDYWGHNPESRIPPLHSGPRMMLSLEVYQG